MIHYHGTPITPGPALQELVGRHFCVSPSWHRRMEQVFNALCPNGPVPVWLHMLRGMALAGSEYPFASVDSVNVARNHKGDNTRGTPAKSPGQMAARLDAIQNPCRWTYREQLELEAA